MEPIEKNLLTSLMKFRRINYQENAINKLNLSQMAVLVKLVESLKYEKHIIMSKLSTMCGLTRPALTQIINRLEEKGYVKREVSNDSRREVLVSITPEGMVVAEKEREKMIHFFERVVERLGVEDTQTFIYLLDKLYDVITNLEKENV